MNKAQKQMAEMFREKMGTDNLWLERGLLAIYARQTADEQSSKLVNHDNGMGFTSADSIYMTWAAQFVLGLQNRPMGQRLSCSEKMREKHLPKVRQKMMKYAAQLVLVAEAKAKAAA